MAIGLLHTGIHYERIQTSWIKCQGYTFYFTLHDIEKKIHFIIQFNCISSEPINWSILWKILYKYMKWQKLYSAVQSVSHLKMGQKGQENNISWLGTYNWGSGRGVTVKCVQYEEFMFIIISHKRFAAFILISTVMV